MKKIIEKKIIRKEIKLIHFILSTTGKLFIGIGIGILISNWALPFSIPLIIIGVLILLPTLHFLFKEEKEEEQDLKKKLK